MSNPFALLLTLLLTSSLQPAMPPPADIVAQFCTLDMQGARLQSTDRDPIWQLTLDDGEPPVSPVAIIDEFRIAHSEIRGNQAIVSVEYQVRGTVDAQHVFHGTRRRTMSSEFVVAKESAWKISLKSLAVSPHVKAEAYLHHLDILILALKGRDHEVERTRLQRLKIQMTALTRQPPAVSGATTSPTFTAAKVGGTPHSNR